MTPVGRAAVLVRAAQALLAERIADPPSLADLAHLLGSNRRQINELFQTCCGQPVFGWLREERLRRAHDLVCRTDTPISEIADHLGFFTAANFTRAFRERFAISPRNLRQAPYRANQGRISRVAGSESAAPAACSRR